MLSIRPLVLCTLLLISTGCRDDGVSPDGYAWLQFVNASPAGAFIPSTGGAPISGAITFGTASASCGLTYPGPQVITLSQEGAIAATFNADLQAARHRRCA